MTDRKLANDATSSAQGTIYEIYFAVQKCFEMTSDQKIIIQRYGDVTVGASQQLEIKHYSDPLTDNHLNFWNTLKNWMQDNFDESAYMSLLLCTTQEIGENSSLRAWNYKTLDDRISILRKIYEDAEKREKNRQQASNGKPSKSLRLQRWIMEPTRIGKLRNVVERFGIADRSPDMTGLYTRIKDIHAKHILCAKRDDFLYALLGFVICPKVVAENSWEIGYDEFATKVRGLSSQYCKGTTQFPVKYLHANQALSPEAVEARKDQPFVRKILDIQYEKVIPDAIVHYLYASQTALHEFREYEVPGSHYRVFAKNVLDQFSPRYRKALRNVSEVIKDSQDFYDDVMMEPPPNFPGFETPPVSFKNGVLHMHSNDSSKDIKWRLENPHE